MLKDLSPESSFHKYAYSDSGFGRGRGEQERIPKTALSRRKQQLSAENSSTANHNFPRCQKIKDVCIPDVH